MALLESYVAQPPPLDETEQDVIRLRGTRVTLDTVVCAYNSGAAPEDMVRSYDTLNLRDVYAIITYYLDHKASVDAYIKRREAEAAELRQEIEASQPSNAEFRARLQARRPDNSGAALSAHESARRVYNGLPCMPTS